MALRFQHRLLETLLAADAGNESSTMIRQDVLPRPSTQSPVFAYPFQDVKTRAQSYWRDVGTIDAYYDATRVGARAAGAQHLRPDWPI